MKNNIPAIGIKLLFITMFSFLISCSGSKQIILQQINDPIVVDGDISDWNTEQTLLNSSDEILYHAALQDDFLYIFVNTRSAHVDRAIRQLGFIVYLSNSKDDRNSVGIGFPAGTFNLLREYPNAYQSFLTDHEWGGKPENRDLMADLSEDAFSKVMIVERHDGGNAEYGFVDISQLEIDGLEISTDQERRLFTLEMKIPVDGTSIYNIQKEDLWIGFTVEPPTFRMQNNNETLSRQERRGYGYGNMGRTQYRQSAQPRLFSKSDWFELKID